MKTISLKTICYSVIITLILSACAQSGDSTALLQEPKADQIIQAPFVEWPRVIDAATGIEYQVVTLPDANTDGTQPQTFPSLELIPYSISPEQASSQQAALAELNIGTAEQVIFMSFPSSWTNEETGEEVNMPALATIAAPTKQMCSALIGHMIYRHTVDGVSWAVITGAIEAYINGQATINVVKTGAGGASAVQFVYQGVKFLLLFGDSTMPPTIVAPVMGNTLGRMAGNLSNLVVGKGKSVNVVQDSVALFKCIKDNWPKSPEDLKKMKDDHNREYSAKHLDSIPETFPMPFPKSAGDEKAEMALVMVDAGDFSRVEKASLNFLIASGLVVAWATPIPGDEVAVTGYALKLAFAP